MQSLDEKNIPGMMSIKFEVLQNKLSEYQGLEVSNTYWLQDDETIAPNEKDCFSVYGIEQDGCKQIIADFVNYSYALGFAVKLIRLYPNLKYKGIVIIQDEVIRHLEL